MARQRIATLEVGALEPAKAIVEAVRESLSEEGPPDEAELAAAIEKRRAFLLASDETIQVTDFGAGSPEDTRSMEEMNQGVRVTLPLSRICSASKGRFWGLLLHKIVRKLGVRSGVELGTCVGISASYQAGAQRLNGEGSFVTLEGCPETAKVATRTLEELGMNNARVVVGAFHETYRPVLEECQPVDYLFIDGHHDRDATIAYFEEAKPMLADEAVVVFDDIGWNEGMREAWRSISKSTGVVFSLNLGQIGIVVFSPNAEGGVDDHEIIL